MTTAVSIFEQYLAAPLRVLALWQPYATLCVAPDPEHDDRPGKLHETRHWFPTQPLPLRVAIHAAAKFDRLNRDYFTEPRFKNALKRCGFFPGDPRPFLNGKHLAGPPAGLAPVPLGAIVGVATVVGIYAVEAPMQAVLDRRVQQLDLAALTDDDRAFGYFVRQKGDPEPYRYAWRLADTFMLPTPVPHSGQRDPLYFPAPETRRAINEQLAAAIARNA